MGIYTKMQYGSFFYNFYFLDEKDEFNLKNFFFIYSVCTVQCMYSVYTINVMLLNQLVSISSN